MIDSFHLEAYGEKAVNYNRDLEVFPVIKRIIDTITGESEYQRDRKSTRLNSSHD